MRETAASGAATRGARREIKTIWGEGGVGRSHGLSEYVLACGVSPQTSPGPATWAGWNGTRAPGALRTNKLSPFVILLGFPPLSLG